MGELQLKKRYTIEEVDYGQKWASIYADMQLKYNGGTETLASDTVNPDWVEAPDFKLAMIWADESVNMDNSWSRAGSVYTKGSITITSIQQVLFRCFIETPWSVKGLKIYNPFAWSAYVSVQGYDSAKTTAKGDLWKFLLKPGQSMDLATNRFVKQAKAAGAAFVCFQFHCYDSALSDNGTLTFTATSFTLPLPETDPRTGLPWGPSFGFDSYNIIDRYGVMLAGIAGGLTGVELAYTGLTDSPLIQSVAEGLGLGAAQVAGILAVGLYEKWINMTDAIEYIIPAIGVGVTPAIASFMMNRMPSKYSNLIGGAGAMALVGAGAGAATVAGSAWVLLSMMDDVEGTFEV